MIMPSAEPRTLLLAVLSNENYGALNLGLGVAKIFYYRVFNLGLGVSILVLLFSS